jgi:hypothetical protein
MDCFQNIRRGVIIVDFKRGISGGSSDRSKKAGGCYWTIDCFQNIGRAGVGAKGGIVNNELRKSGSYGQKRQKSNVQGLVKNEIGGKRWLS